MTADEATLRQIAAADPGSSVWLSANAGSGKTRVLTDRVARLLLDGTDPRNILCLTYTKAAASEMQNRLFRRLGEWAMLADGLLAAELAKLGVTGALGPARLARARTLFAQAMEVPGGLRIQTIHAFCAGLLRRFPLEAGVSPGFTEMEDRAAALMRAEVVDAMAAGPDRPLVDGLAQHFTGADFDRFLQAITGAAERLLPRPAETAVRAALGVAPGLTVAALVDSVLSVADRRLLVTLVNALSTGSVNDVKAGVRLSSVLAGHSPGLADMAVLESVFLFASGKTPFAAKVGTFPTKATRAANPDLLDDLDDLMTRVEAARGDRLALQALNRSLALHRFAAAFLPAYAARKAALGMLDFDDLILRARQLLTDDKVAQWVLFRLDGGLDHILVDEAQDTSPLQWAVIERLTQEFAAGQGARPDRERTIFVVGDRKQSIYSFQGADPSAFDRMEAEFRDRLGRIDRALVPLTLDWSFRSSPAVLRAVDMTFAAPSHHGLGQDGPRHLAFKDQMPGRVDLWPAVPPADNAKAEDSWTDPVDRLGSRHPSAILAGEIAQAIARMWKSERLTVQRGNDWVTRALTPGDILILVQRRSPLFSAIIRALKSAGLPVAGADRLRLGGELAVKDIAALLRFLDLPEDDLSLAAALRSPLFGWSEQDIYSLAQPRPDKSWLWTALRDARGAHPQTFAILDDLRGQAEYLRPYDLINRVLLRHDGRRRLLARLGPEAEDGIDALLAQALAYERSEVPGLTGFLGWLETEDIEVKRQLDSGGGLIRVMTVHAAKGLEAPVVILPDSGVRRAADAPPILPGPVPLWSTPAGDMPPAMRALREERAERDEEERRRLLYVAMTRAESWLIVCAAGETGEGEDSWHAMAQAGLLRAGAVALTTPLGQGLRLAHGDWAAAPPVPAVAAPAPGPLPRADYPAAPPPPAAPLGRSPSDLGGAKVLPGETAPEEAEAALARGSFVHLLLEHLPQIPRADRPAAAAALLAAQDAPGLLGDAALLIADVISLLDSPTRGHLFTQGQAEVALCAPLAELAGERLAGAIDRLIISPEHIAAIDYKTNRLVPSRPEEVPEGILRQMGAYLAMLAQVFPGRPLRGAILWTATGALMPLPHDLCSAALRRAARP